MKTTKKLISILLSIALILGCVLPVSATQTDIQTIIDDSVQYLYSQNEQAVYGKEWAIMAIASSDYQVDENYYNDYVDSIVMQMDENGGKLKQSTDYSRVILALSSIGFLPEQVGDYNLLEALADYRFVSKQGLNGPVYALLALDSANYEIPQIEVTELATRQKYIDFILDNQVTNGGWTFWGDEADPDMTAMAIQALAPYTNQIEVQQAVDRALEVLSQMQSETGGFASWGVEGAESVGQIIIALCYLNIDADTDSRFVKGENSALDNLLSFYLDDGTFTHALKNASSNLMATQQSALALIAYDKFVQGDGDIYDYIVIHPTWEAHSNDDNEEKVEEVVVESRYGWKKADGKWTYYTEDGQSLTGWNQIGASWYYFNSDGNMVTGWVYSNGNWYYMHSVGSMAVGWTQVGPSWFYFGTGGAMLKATTTPDGYTVNENGNWIA